MSNFEVPTNPTFSEEIRKFETTDPAHANLFNEVVEKLFLNTLHNKLISTVYSYDGTLPVTLDTKEGSFLLKKIYGNSIRKNLLLPSTGLVAITNGVTFKFTTDGTLSISGTATDSTTFYLFENLSLAPGNYKITTGNYIGKNVSLHVYLGKETGGFYTNKATGQYVNTLSFSLDVNATARIYVMVESGTTVNNTLTLSMPAPYFSSVGDEGSIGITTTGNEESSSVEIALDKPLRGISDKVYDTLELYANGSGKHIQRLGYIDSYASEEITGEYISTNNLTEGASVIYALDEPIETNLSVEQVKAMLSLKSYDGETTVSTDSAASVLLEYGISTLVTNLIEHITSKGTHNTLGHVILSDVYNSLVGNESQSVGASQQALYNLFSLFKNIGMFSNTMTSVEWDDIKKTSSTMVTFFTNWSNSTDFPAVYGSGVIIPCLDARTKKVLYLVNGVLYTNDMGVTDNSYTMGTWYGYLPSTGGTLSGNLSLKTSNVPKITVGLIDANANGDCTISKNASAENDYGSYFRDASKDGKFVSVQLYGKSQEAKLVFKSASDSEEVYREIMHSGNIESKILSTHTYSTTDLTAGTSSLTTGKQYLVYE